MNDGYSIDGQVIQGTRTFFTTTLTHDVTVIWTVAARTRPDHRLGHGPERGWKTRNQWSGASGIRWDPLEASIDSNIEAIGSGVRFRTVGYTLYNKTGAIISPGINPGPPELPFPAAPFLFLDDNAARRASVPLSISEPVRLMWNFVGQVRYRFDAANATSRAPPSTASHFSECITRIG